MTLTFSRLVFCDLPPSHPLTMYDGGLHNGRDFDIQKMSHRNSLWIENYLNILMRVYIVELSLITSNFIVKVNQKWIIMWRRAGRNYAFSFNFIWNNNTIDKKKIDATDTNISLRSNNISFLGCCLCTLLPNRCICQEMT